MKKKNISPSVSMKRMSMSQMLTSETQLKSEYLKKKTLKDKESLHWTATWHLIRSKMNTLMTCLNKSMKKNSIIKVVMKREYWLVQKQILPFDTTKHSVLKFQSTVIISYWEIQKQTHKRGITINLWLIKFVIIC